MDDMNGLPRDKRIIRSVIRLPKTKKEAGRLRDDVKRAYAAGTPLYAIQERCPFYGTNFLEHLVKDVVRTAKPDTAGLTKQLAAQGRDARWIAEHCLTVDKTEIEKLVNETPKRGRKRGRPAKKTKKARSRKTLTPDRVCVCGCNQKLKGKQRLYASPACQVRQSRQSREVSA